MPTNRRLPVAVETNLPVGRLKDPAVSRGEVPVPMSDPPFALIGVAVGRPSAEHSLAAVIETLEDAGTPHAGIIPCPSHNEGLGVNGSALLVVSDGS